MAGRPQPLDPARRPCSSRSRTIDLGFSVHFQQPSEKRVDPGEVCALLAAILAHGSNLGLYAMEKVTPDIACRRLKYVSDWRFAVENQQAALAPIVHGIPRCGAAGHWGNGTTSASDRQRFAMPHRWTYSTRSALRAERCSSPKRWWKPATGSSAGRTVKAARLRSAAWG